jgi:hypothetical protein
MKTFMQQGLSDTMITVCQSGVIGVNGWQAYERSLANLFSFEKDPSHLNEKYMIMQLKKKEKKVWHSFSETFKIKVEKVGSWTVRSESRDRPSHTCAHTRLEAPGHRRPLGQQPASLQLVEIPQRCAHISTLE